MGNCDMCGKEEKLVSALVEGSVVSVCSNCSKYGNVLEPKKLEKSKFHSRETISLEETEVIVNDYSKKVKEARQKMGIKQEDVAKAIAERESVIQKIESGHMEPSFPVAKKLEQFLRIKLITQEEVTKEIDKSELFGDDSKNITIGDLIKIRKKKKI